MLDQVFAAFGERPDIDLALMRENQTLPGLTADVITGMTRLLGEVAPDLVLVHGDTTTAMATAVAAFYAGRAIGHVEAGLRSFDLARPFPEEFNRVAIDSLAALMFAPTAQAAANLAGETRRGGKVFVTGNTGIDALLYLSEAIDANPDRSAALAARYGIAAGRRLVLVTGHRRESFGQGLRNICDALLRVASELDVDVLYPVHLNPRVRETVLERLGNTARIRLIDPVEYADMVFLMKRASVIVTDSGGIQEEAPALARPVLVTREVTERPEGLAEGRVELVGSDPKRIFDRVAALLDAPPLRPAFPYGDGKAAAAIVDIITRELLT
jgi:UDP-N-acetylglucosamine 2-epimerase